MSVPFLARQELGLGGVEFLLGQRPGVLKRGKLLQARDQVAAARCCRWRRGRRRGGGWRLLVCLERLQALFLVLLAIGSLLTATACRVAQSADHRAPQKRAPTCSEHSSSSLSIDAMSRQ